MAFEIERKFLLASNDWRESVERSRPIELGYLFKSHLIAVRISVTPEGGLVCVKRPTADPVVRHELEEIIPRPEAEQLLATHCRPKTIIKTRHYLGPWEIDEFHGANDGLFVAEIEMKAADEAFPQPSWLGDDVTHNPIYLNTSLMDYPFCDWTF